MKIDRDHLVIDTVTDSLRNQGISLIISDISSNESNLLYRSKTETLRLLKRKNIALAFNRTQLAGFLLKLNLTKHWSELTTLYVRPEYRGQGVARQLIALSIQNRRDENFIMLTKNPAVIKILKDFGFLEIKYSSIPLSAKLGMLIDVSRNTRRLMDLVKGLPEENQVKIMFKRMGKY